MTTAMINQPARVVEPVTVSDYLRSDNLAFQVYTATDRGVPLVNSGLKLGAQRLLWSMWQDGLKPTAKPRKSAKNVAAATGAYHPHGQAGMYDTLVTLAVPYERLPLIEGIGAFGISRGDTEASDRYTESRLNDIGAAALEDAALGAVPMRPTYDNDAEEPCYLAPRIPMLLARGSFGLAEGWQTNTPSHNPVELCRATLAYIKNRGDLPVEELTDIMPGPDWGSGGVIVGGRSKKGIADYYTTGRGRITVRARYHIEGKKIIITELPPGVGAPATRSALREKVRAGEISGVSDVQDLTGAKSGLKLVVTVKRGTKPEAVVADMFAQTQLESTFAASIVALDEDLAPRVWSVYDLLDNFVTMRDTAITRRAEARKAKLDHKRVRAHALAVVSLGKDKAARIILNADDKTTAADELARQFKLTGEQAHYVLGLPMHRLTKADALEAQRNLDALDAEIKDLAELIADPERRRLVMLDETQAEVDRFTAGDYERRTSLRFDEQASTGSGADMDAHQALTDRWKFDPATGMLGEDGEPIAAGEVIWAVDHAGKVKLFAGAGLPKKVQPKPIIPNLSELLACGTVNLDTHPYLVFTTQGTGDKPGVRMLRIDLNDLRTSGITAGGVAGIKLRDGDHIAAIHPCGEDTHVYITAGEGWKVLRAGTVPVKGRGTYGPVVYRMKKTEGPAVAQFSDGGFVDAATGEVLVPTDMAKAPARSQVEPQPAG